jgi:titin
MASWGPPVLVSSTPGDGSVEIVWSFPADSAWWMINGFSATCYSGTTYIEGASIPANDDLQAGYTQFTNTFTNLTSGTQYTFNIVSWSNDGSYGETLTFSAIPVGAPGPVASFTTATWDSEINIVFTAPTNIGGAPITGYSIQWGTDSAGTNMGSELYGSNASSLWITSLTNGILYYFTVAAKNLYGLGPYTTVSARPGVKPTIPQNFTGTGINGGVNLSWTAPSSIGALSITSYYIQYSTDNATWNETSNNPYSGTTLSAPFTGLTNGTLYYFQLQAENNAGLYSAYTTTSATPSTAPTAVTSLSATIGNNEVILTWAAPNYNGGIPLSPYSIQYSTSSTGPWISAPSPSATALTSTISGLTNGTLYYFQIAALNSSGTGPYTAVSATPLTTPTDPMNLSCSIGDTILNVSWSVPSSNGGSNITGYSLQYGTGPNGPWSSSASLSSSSLSYPISGLTNGTLYYVQVAAVNSVGTGPYSTNSATPSTVPLAPVINSSTSNQDQSSIVSWTVPANGGASITSYNLQYSSSSSAPYQWSSVIPYTLPPSLSSATTLSYTITGLTNGTLYYFQVAAVNLNGAGAYSSQATNSTQTANTATPSTVPLAPVINSSTSNQDQSSIVSWTVPANGGASITSYNLQYSSSSSAPYQWSSVIPYTLPPSLSSATTLSYTITGLTNGTLYYFQVAAVNVSGQGPYSSQATNSTQTANTATPSTVPLAPGITSSTSNQNTVSTISWTVPANGGLPITSYNLQYSSSSSAPYQWSSVIPYTLPPSLSSATTLSYTISGLTNGTLYYFQVAAVNVNGEGPYSSQATNSTQLANTATPSTTPTAPVINSSTSNQDQSSIVSWTVPANGGLPITSYNLQYSSSSSPYQWSSVITYTLPLSLYSATTLSYPISGLTNGTLYYFQVAAVNVNGEGPYSSQATNSTQTANTATPSTIPTVPVINSSQSNQNTVSTVSWTVPSYNGGASITSYNLQYSSSSSAPYQWSSVIPYTLPPSLSSATTLSYTITGLTNGTLYYFQVAAVNLSGQGPYSSQATNSSQIANTATPSSIPSAPIITSSLSNQNTVSTVSWTAPADNGLPITSYNLQYSTSSSGWLPVTPYKVPPTTSYIFQNLTNGTEYFFQVAAVNFNGQGPYSSQPENSTQVTNSAIPSTTPNAPTILFSVSHQDQMSKVSWATLNNYDTGGVPIISYSLQYSTSSVGPWLPSPTTSYNVVAPTTTFIFPNLTNRIRYYFQVAAVNINGTGKYSVQTLTSTAIPSTIPDAPSITSSISNQNQMSTVNWTAPVDDGGRDISSYNLQYSENSFGPWLPIEPHIPFPPTSLTYTFKGLTNGTTYYFQVAAVNSNGRSRYSSHLTNLSEIANSATPSTTPGAPVINYSTSYHDQTSTVNWTAPSDNGGLSITSYSLQYSTDSIHWSPATLDNLPATTRTHTIRGLTNGTTYYFQVAAVNLNGTGTYSSRSSNSVATPSTIPDVPVILYSASNQDQSSIVSWTVPANGGATITSYKLQYSSSSAPYQWSQVITYTLPSPPPLTTTLSYRITGLTNGTLYYFQVAAVNVSGQGPYSSQPANSTEVTNTATPSTFPTAPVILSSASNQDQSSTISWIVPSNGGASITSYNLQYSSSSSAPYQWSQVIPYPLPSSLYSATELSYTITGLTNGTLYYFQVAAVNLNGVGTYSSQPANSTQVTNTATPSRIPIAPVITSSTSNQNTVSTVNWTVPTDNGGALITSYNLQYSSISAPYQWSQVIPYTLPLSLYSATELSYTITGLTNGTLYYFQVAAVNVNGQGPYSSQPANSTQVTNTATPSTVPTAPIILSSTSNQNQSSTISWTVPSNGGASITLYNLQYSSSSSAPYQWSSIIPYTVPLSLYSSSTLSYTITGLTNGTLYYFQVAAVNLNGAGTYSSQPANSTQITNTATPSTIPNPPTNLYGDGYSDNGIIYLSWDVPYDGGSVILSYNIQYCISSTGLWIQIPPYIPPSSTELLYTISGLTNGAQYDFQVSALNINGESSYSTTSATPSTTPEPPVMTVSTPYSNQMITVMWNIPYDGGDPISSYDLQYGTSASGSWVSVSSYIPSTQVTYTFYNLTNDVEYYFQIAAINDNGYGSYSTIINDTPSVTSKPPSLITATKITSSSIALSWTAPSLPSTSGNPVTEYNIQWTNLSTNNTNIGKSSTTTYIITDLSYATQYKIQISSTNGSGIGALSDPPVYFTTLSNLPSAPTNLSITGCNTGYYSSIILKWTAPYDDGSSPIKNYIIYYRPTNNPTTWNTHTTNSSDTTATIKVRSTNILYDFKIAAENSAGIGVFSNIINGLSNDPPSPPSNLAANTTESGLIVLTWGESVQNPPESISYYFIEYKINSFGGWMRFKVNIPGDVAEVILDDPNIANNVLYLFRVYAVNTAGAQSDSSNIASATSYNNSLPMYLWSRFSPNCGSNVSTATNPLTDNLERQMLKKASVLQYFNTGSLNFTTKQLWAMAARNGLTRKKSYATQTQDYTNANTTNMTNPTIPNIGLNEVNNSLACWTPQSSVICNLTSASNVPGTVKPLCFSLKAPYNNYRNPKTVGSGGTKLMFLY